MPNYDRKCDRCGKEEEVRERMGATGAKQCACGGKMWRQIGQTQPPLGLPTPKHWTK